MEKISEIVTIIILIIGVINVLGIMLSVLFRVFNFILGEYLKKKGIDVDAALKEKEGIDNVKKRLQSGGIVLSTDVSEFEILNKFHGRDQFGLIFKHDDKEQSVYISEDAYNYFKIGDIVNIRMNRTHYNDLDKDDDIIYSIDDTSLSIKESAN